MERRYYYSMDKLHVYQTETVNSRTRTIKIDRKNCAKRTDVHVGDVIVTEMMLSHTLAVGRVVSVQKAEIRMVVFGCEVNLFSRPLERGDSVSVDLAFMAHATPENTAGSACLYYQLTKDDDMTLEEQSVAQLQAAVDARVAAAKTALERRIAANQCPACIARSAAFQMAQSEIGRVGTELCRMWPVEWSSHQYEGDPHYHLHVGYYGIGRMSDTNALSMSDACVDYETKSARLPEHAIYSERICRNDVVRLNQDEAWSWINCVVAQKVTAFNQRKALAIMQFPPHLTNYAAFKKEYDVHYSKKSGRWFFDSRSRAKDCSFLWHAYRCRK